MAVLLTRQEETYPVGSYNVERRVNNGVVTTRIKITLSDPGTWPVGPVLRVLLTDPDGNVAGGFDMSGGHYFPRGSSVRATERSAVFEIFDSNGQPGRFPTGVYRLDFQVLQPITTAVLVERF